MTGLTMKDVARLVEEPSPDARVETAAKIATGFGGDRFDAHEREIAEQIFRVMIHDAEVRVRQALSEQLKGHPEVPRDVALVLAADVADVAVPILNESPVLTDDDLIDIVRDRPTEHRMAVARRESVSPAVCDALVESGEEVVVATMVGNPGADIAEATFGAILDGFPDSNLIKEGMTERASLPVRVAERLVTMVSERLRERLVTHHALSPDLAADLILDTREKATLGLLHPEAERLDVEDLVDQLHDNGRLTTSIVLRALFTGDLPFFESAMARLARVPVANAYLLIHDRGGLGLRELYGRAGLSDELFPVVRAAVDVAQDMTYDGQDRDRERYRARMIERLITYFDDRDEGIDAENLDYLLARLRQAPDAAHAMS